MLFRAEIKGYKSIRDISLDLGRINLIIGSNGVGKSNFIAAFRLVKDIYNKNLQQAVIQEGGASRILHFGRKVTGQITLSLHLGYDQDPEARNRYSVDLGETDDKLFIARTTTAFYNGQWHEQVRETSKWESSFQYDRSGQAYYVSPMIDSLDVFHFHDTGAKSPLKQTCYISDNARLRPDGANLPAMLYLLKMKHPSLLADIEAMVSTVYPLFSRFVLEPENLSPDYIKLHWNQVGSDYLFNAGQLSDGTLRFIALAALLMHPDLSGTVIIDEPELGLHPNAISILSSLIKKAAGKAQVIASTQSVDLINNFTPEDILVAFRKENATEFKRLSSADLGHWMDEYTLGEMWIKNVFGE